jgi:hypothetical protein
MSYQKNPSFHTDFKKGTYDFSKKCTHTNVSAKKLFYQLKSPKQIGSLGKFVCTFYYLKSPKMQATAQYFGKGFFINRF